MEKVKQWWTRSIYQWVTPKATIDNVNKESLSHFQEKYIYTHTHTHTLAKLAGSIEYVDCICAER